MHNVATQTDLEILLTEKDRYNLRKWVQRIKTKQTNAIMICESFKTLYYISPFGYFFHRDMYDQYKGILLVLRVANSKTGLESS